MVENWSPEPKEWEVGLPARPGPQGDAKPAREALARRALIAEVRCAGRVPVDRMVRDPTGSAGAAPIILEQYVRRRLHCNNSEITVKTVRA
jgi:hypothetical protein